MPRIKELQIGYSLKDFSSWVDDQRKEEGLTLEQLGMLLGYTGQWAGAKIRHRSWTLAEFLILCKRFGATEEDLRRFTKV